MTQFVIVHAGQIVMDQRIGMNSLDRTARIDRRVAIDPVELRRGNQQQRAHTLAATDRGIAHRLDQSCARIVGHRKKRISAVDLTLHPLEGAQKVGHAVTLTRRGPCRKVRCPQACHRVPPDLLDPRLRRVEPLLAGFAQLFAAFVKVDALVERHIAAFCRRTTLELAEGLLEAQIRNL